MVSKKDTRPKEAVLERARVIALDRDIYKVKTETKELKAEVSGRFRYETSSVSDFPVVGDYVLVESGQDKDLCIITALYPRKSCFIRKAAGREKQEQVVAANIDYCFICMSLNNDYNLRRLERYLSVAWNSGATPVVVLTKADLCNNIETKLTEVGQVAQGVDVITVSAYLDEFEEVYEYIRPGQTVAFLGSSGVGKSTLINRLLGDNKIKTQGLRNDDKGRHTTTGRDLMECHGLSRPDILIHFFELIKICRNRDNINPLCYLANLSQLCLYVVTQISLGKYYNRCGTAVPCY